MEGDHIRGEEGDHKLSGGTADPQTRGDGLGGGERKIYIMYTM